VWGIHPPRFNPPDLKRDGRRSTVTSPIVARRIGLLLILSSQLPRPSSKGAWPAGLPLAAESDRQNLSNVVRTILVCKGGEETHLCQYSKGGEECVTDLCQYPPIGFHQADKRPRISSLGMLAAPPEKLAGASRLRSPHKAISCLHFLHSTRPGRRLQPIEHAGPAASTANIVATSCPVASPCCHQCMIRGC
jgi:hypothetical protein